MDDLIERYLGRVEDLKSDATFDTFRQNLRQFDRWLDQSGYEVGSIEPLELEEHFIAMIGEDYAPNSISSRYAAISGLYSFLTDTLETVDDNPLEGLERSDYVEKGSKKHGNSDIIYVTAEEKEALCEHVPTPKLRNELIIRLLWQTGVRKTELANIELDDLHREERSISIWSNKTKEWRSVFFQPSLDLLLDQWLDGGYRASYKPAHSSPYLFVTERSERVYPDTINRKIVRPAAENADIQEVMYHDKGGNARYRITPHALRHGHGVHALKSGIDVRTVQKHLGHTQLEMTMRYLQLVEDDVREGYRRFNSAPAD